MINYINCYYHSNSHNGCNKKIFFKNLTLRDSTTGDAGSLPHHANNPRIAAMITESDCPACFLRI